MTLRHLRSNLLDWWHEGDGKHAVTLGAVLLAAALCIGIVFAGETELIEGDPCPPIAATSPTVAAQVTDPTVEALRLPPVGSVATVERCEP